LALIFGLCAVVASSISGKNSSTLRAHAEPAGQPHGEPETAVVAELDKLASEEEAATETEVVSPEPPETAKPIEPPALTHPEPARPPLLAAEPARDESARAAQWVSPF